MIVATEHKYIVKDKKICGGEPVIKGTRILVRILFNMYENSFDIANILEAYPHLSKSQVHDALSYAYDNIEEIRELIDKQETS